MRLPLLLSPVLLVLLAGCDTGPPTRTISGEVTFEGQPIEEGEIIFRSADGGAVATADIRDGRYETEATLGQKTVQIEAYRETGPPDPDVGPALEQYLPSKYNSNTELEAEVTEEGDGVFDFQLSAQ